MEHPLSRHPLTGDDVTAEDMDAVVSAGTAVIDGVVVGSGKGGSNEKKGRPFGKKTPVQFDGDDKLQSAVRQSMYMVEDDMAVNSGNRFVEVSTPDAIANWSSRKSLQRVSASENNKKTGPTLLLSPGRCLTRGRLRISPRPRKQRDLTSLVCACISQNRSAGNVNDPLRNPSPEEASEASGASTGNLNREPQFLEVPTVDENLDLINHSSSTRGKEDPTCFC